MSHKSDPTLQFCQSYTNPTIESLNKDPKNLSSSKSSSVKNFDETKVVTKNLNPNRISQVTFEESDKLQKCLPIMVNGTVIHGFGRGSSELGIRTANYSEEIVDAMPEEFQSGIYYCWAQIVYTNQQPEVEKEDPEIFPENPTITQKHTKILPAVMSVGWNPYYNNEKKSMETHIIQKFENDWYDNQLRVVIVGRLRSEKNYDSLQALIDDINKDIEDTKGVLTSEWSKECCLAEEFFY